MRFRGRLYVDPLFISISILKKIPVKDKVLPCFAKAFHIFLYDQLRKHPSDMALSNAESMIFSSTIWSLLSII